MQIIGQRFGRLIVKDYAPRKGYVLCQCDCGTVKTIQKSSLTKTKQPTRSCGCLQSDAMRRNGANTIIANSQNRIATDVKYHTNFGIIESSKPSVRNRSGHKGVWHDAKRGKYEACICVHRRLIHLGRFDTYEDAVKAREQAEEKYFLPLIEKKQEEQANASNS